MSGHRWKVFCCSNICKSLHVLVAIWPGYMCSDFAHICVVIPPFSNIEARQLVHSEKMVSGSSVCADQSPQISLGISARIVKNIQFVASAADAGFNQYGSNFPLLTDSPVAKKTLLFPSPTESRELAVLANVVVAVSEEDEEPLINLRQKARAQWKSKLVESTATGVTSKSASALKNTGGSMPATCHLRQPGLAQVATRRFTRSQADQALATLCPPKKRSRGDTQVESNAGNPPFSGKQVTHVSPIPIPPLSVFRSSLHRGLWPFVCARSFRREHSLVPAKVNHLGTIDLLRDLGISNTLLNVPSFVKNVVLEFYCNLSADMTTVQSQNFHKTFVRGVFVDFSPEVINEFVGSVPVIGVSMSGGMHIVVSELTGGLLKSWPASGVIRASCLSYKYSVLHKVALRNWMPNTHSSLVRKDLALLLYQIGTKGTFDFGKLVFDQVIKHTEKQLVQKPLGFPSLIFGIIQSQHDVLTESDVYEPDAPNVVVTDKLRNATYHVNDAPAALFTDADVVYSEPQSFSDEGLQDFQRELVVRELELQSAYLGRLIKSSQSRKSMLDALLSDLSKSGGSSAVGGGAGSSR